MKQRNTETTIIGGVTPYTEPPAKVEPVKEAPKRRKRNSKNVR